MTVMGVSTEDLADLAVGSRLFHSLRFLNFGLTGFVLFVIVCPLLLHK